MSPCCLIDLVWFFMYALCCFVVFLMIRRPPRSTLFPYTRSSDLTASPRAVPTAVTASTSPAWPATWMPRSEEHTSELQSRSDLVCRLLLANKRQRILDEIIEEKQRPAARHDSNKRLRMHNNKGKRTQSSSLANFFLKKPATTANSSPTPPDPLPI